MKILGSESFSERKENIVEKATSFLENLDDMTKDDFVNSVLSFRDWNVPADFSKVLTRFVQVNEAWWYNHRPNIDEW